jgi:hypothetical protein
MKLRTIGMATVAALALIATRAQAQADAAVEQRGQSVPPASATVPAAGMGRDAGWNTKYGMLFQAQNIFTQPGFLNGYGAGVGLQFNLAPQRAIRVAVNVGRSSDPIEKNEVTNGATSYTTETVPAETSSLDLDIGAQYVLRLTSAALSPYIGAGAGLYWNSSYRDGTETDSRFPGITTTYDSSYRTAGVGAVGTLGLEWRIHSMLSIFAEYGLNVGIYESRNDDVKTSSGGTVYESKTTSSKFFNFDTGLNQGGQLGVVAFF